MNLENKAAEILVESGYADFVNQLDKKMGRATIMHRGVEINTCATVVRPFADTLEGRKQADAIENWLHINEPELVRQAKHCTEPTPYDGRKKRLVRLVWCLEQLDK